MPGLRMVTIRVIKMPSGNMPERIRAQWVGLILRGWILESVPVKSIMTGKPSGPKSGFGVPFEPAMQALVDAGMEEAADYFKMYMRKRNIDTSTQGVFFNKEAIEIVSQ